MSQKAFAEAAGFQEAMVSRWVNEQAFPEDKQFDIMVTIFKCSYEDLVRDPEKRSAPLPVQVEAAIKELARRAGYKLVKDG